MRQPKTIFQAVLVGFLLSVGCLVYAQDTVSPAPKDVLKNDKACASCSIGSSCEGCSSVKGTGTETEIQCVPPCNWEVNCEYCLNGRCHQQCQAKNCEICSGMDGRCEDLCNPASCQRCDGNGNCKYQCKENQDCIEGRCRSRCSRDKDCSRPNCELCEEGHCSLRSLCDNFFRCERCVEGICKSRCKQEESCDQSICRASIPCNPPCNLDACERCDGRMGACVTNCNFFDCERCDGHGSCRSTCGPDERCNNVAGRCEFLYPPYT